MKFYASKSYQAGCIKENANIAAFSSIEDMRAYLLAPYDASQWIHDTAVIEPAPFQDCWVKTYGAFDRMDLTPFKSADEMSLQLPGSHPGGKATWITPACPIYVLVDITAIA
jgi:hypothetical protein